MTSRVQEPGLEDVFLAAAQRDYRARGDEVSPRSPRRRLTIGRSRSSVIAVNRRFGAFTAVDAVDLSVRTGEIFGLLGPNGAGKTTLIKMMCGLLEPTAGTIAIGGIDVRTERERVWTAIGYMSQRFSLYHDLTVRQNLRLYADLYGLETSAYTDLMAWLGLDPFASRLTRDLPAGRTTARVAAVRGAAPSVDRISRRADVRRRSPRAPGVLGSRSTHCPATRA